MIATYRTVIDGWGIIGYDKETRHRIYMRNGTTFRDPQIIEIFPDRESAELAIIEWQTRWAGTVVQPHTVQVTVTIKIGE